MTTTEPVDDLGYDAIEASAVVAGDFRNPYPDLAAARERHAIQEGDFIPDIPRDPDGPQSFTVYSCELVSQVLRDNHHFSSQVYAEMMGPVMGHSILEMDEPEHKLHRALVSQAFRHKALARWEEELVGSVCDGLIDRFADKGATDLVRSYTFPFPVQVIARILGLPRADYAKFQRWSVELISVGWDWDRGIAASHSLRDYFKDIVDKRRQDPEDDLISDLVCAEIDGQQLTDEEIFAFLRLLLPAGAETTYRSSSSLLFSLLTNPDQLDAVRADRSLLPQAIEEGIRHEPPLLFIVRSALTDVEVGGTHVPAGSVLSVCIGAANRDPAKFKDPDRFDIFRDAKQHISFGFGPHMCLGMHLARMETRVALNRLFDRLPNLRLDPAGEDVHVHGLMFRSPKSLPILFDPA
ncbi:MAG: cytochrome P450 [Acidimicrobiia bacterium]|nr:cytochrome P450 [Acidimicrobiia bacterium]